MSAKRTLSIGLIAAGTAIAATAASSFPGSRAGHDVTCAIEAQRGDGGWVITGSATSAVTAVATYTLIVTGEGRSGDLDISQSGDVGLRADQAVQFGKVLLAGRDGTLVAVLEVASGGSRASCRKRLDLR